MPLSSRFLLFAVLTFLAATPLHAKPAATTLRELTQRAAVIAVARVIKVERVDGVRLAWATVLQPIKGSRQDQTFVYVAQPTWTCDSSTAVLGEITLLFLDPFYAQRFAAFYPKEGAALAAQRAKQIPGVPLYEIAANGTGRMPLIQQAGKSFLRCLYLGGPAPGKGQRYLNSMLIQLPIDFVLVPDPEATSKAQPGHALASLASVEARIRRMLAAPHQSAERGRNH